MDRQTGGQAERSTAGGAGDAVWQASECKVATGYRDKRLLTQILKNNHLGRVQDCVHELEGKIPRICVHSLEL